MLMNPAQVSFNLLNTSLAVLAQVLSLTLSCMLAGIQQQGYHVQHEQHMMTRTCRTLAAAAPLVAASCSCRTEPHMQKLLLQPFISTYSLIWQAADCVNIHVVHC